VADQFAHVMVLTSIIIGLGITHILVGVGSAIERVSGVGSRLRLSWAHAGWLGYVFVWMVFFWWWQFRLLELLTRWTLGHYFLIVFYAVLLFLLAVILIPSDWDAIDSLDDYLLSKRRWFYTVLLVTNLADLLDSYFKGGWEYVLDLGAVSLAGTAATIPICIAGVRSRNIRVHSVMAIASFVWLVITGFDVFPNLSF